VGKRLSISALTGAERLVLAGAALGVVNGFVPWWYRARIATGTVTYAAGLTTWSTLAVGASFVAAAAVLARASIWPDPAPRSDGGLYVSLGVAAMGLLVAGAVTGSGAWLGLYAGIALAAAVAWGGVRRWTERRSGWT